MLNIRDAIKGRIPELPTMLLQPQPVVTIGQVIRMQKVRTIAPIQRTPKCDKFPQFDVKRVHRHYLHHILHAGMWQGRQCFLVGGGPSLSKFDWSRLDGELVIGINRAYEVGDWAINISMDADLIYHFENGTFGAVSASRWKQFSGIRAWWTDSKSEFQPADENHFYNNYIIEPAGRTEFPLVSPGRLSAANNTGYLALNLACVLGANPIYLLGFDMTGDGAGKQAWWHSGYDQSRMQGDGVYDTMIQDFTELKSRLDKLGISVINLNKRSRLTCYPRKSWTEAKIQKVRRPTIVTTISSPVDERCADELRLSAAVYGLDCPVVENKPVRKDNVLWLDPRSHFTRYPGELDNCADVKAVQITSVKPAYKPTVVVGTSHPEPIPGESDINLFHLIPKKSWRGHRCFIIGGGPSVLGHDLSRLAGELTIGVNRAYELLSSSILFSIDTRFYNWAEHGSFGPLSHTRFRSYPGVEAWLRVRNTLKVAAKGVYIVDVPGWNGDNSGHAAINLASELGASPIYLIGFDMHGADGHPAWFHSGYPVLPPLKIYSAYIERMERYAPGQAKAHGVEIVNLTPGSALKCFPFADYDEVLDTKPTRPVLISYYTPGTGYAREAVELVKTAGLYGLETDVVPVVSRGGWKANTYYKAEFIKSMLNKHRRAVLWVDADARVMQYPGIFDNCDVDIAVHYRDFSRFPLGKHTSGKELLSGTLFVNYTQPALDIMDRWIKANQCAVNVPYEQRNLQSVLAGKHGANILQLPPTYCQIVDSMAAAGEPVILHTQASRRLRAEVGA